MARSRRACASLVILGCATHACDGSNSEPAGAAGRAGATAGSAGAGAGGRANPTGGKGGVGAAGKAGASNPSAGSDSGAANEAGEGNGTGGSAAGAGGSGGASSNAGRGGSAAGTGGSAGAVDSLTVRHPDEASLVADPAVLFHDDFEAGWGRWDAPDEDTDHLFIESDQGVAHAGSGYLRSTVTEAQLDVDEYISSSTQVTFTERVDTIYWRFYAQFRGISATPHHWVRMVAGTDAYNSSGLANTVPPGDQGFWFDFDADTDDRFNFYVYWHQMRSSNCNDGSTTPGCAGDQGTSDHYGNSFAPPDQTPFPRDSWLCIEIMAKANRIGESDGALAYAVDDTLRGDYRPGFPDGTWLRDSFHPGGCSFSACTDPVPFEGFEFRTDGAVQFKGIFLDAYYQRNTSADRRAELEGRGLTVSSEQTIFYDDVVVATTRIGCGRFP